MSVSLHFYYNNQVVRGTLQSYLVVVISVLESAYGQILTCVLTICILYNAFSQYVNVTIIICNFLYFFNLRFNLLHILNLLIQVFHTCNLFSNKRCNRLFPWFVIKNFYDGTAVFL